MNGATAEPLVSTIRPPKIAISTSTGSSQNFFPRQHERGHVFQERHHPLRTAFPATAAVDAALLRARSSSCCRAARRIPIGSTPNSAHHQPGRHDRDRIHRAEKDRIGDLVQQQAELHPAAVGALQQLGLDERSSNQHEPDCHQRAAERADLPVPPGACAAERESDRPDHEAEALVARPPRPRARAKTPRAVVFALRTFSD